MEKREKVKTLEELDGIGYQSIYGRRDWAREGWPEAVRIFRSGLGGQGRSGAGGDGASGRKGDRWDAQGDYCSLQDEGVYYSHYPSHLVLITVV